MTTNETLSRRTIDSPIGPLTLEAGPDGLRAIYFARLAATSGSPDSSSTDLDAAERQLGEYFSGRRQSFDLRLDPRGTPFQHQAWSALRQIAYGETISYGEQARRLGDRNKSRAVGLANGRNPLPIVVPCHRVVGANGKLTGFAGGLEAKAWLLDHERATLMGATGSGG